MLAGLLVFATGLGNAAVGLTNGTAGLPNGAVPAVPLDSRALGKIESGFDYHSFSNTDQFTITHLALALVVDFKAQVLRGSVSLEIKRLDPRAGELVLDTRDLRISTVTQLATDFAGATEAPEETWVNRPFRVDKPDPILGSPLVIDLPPSGRPVEFVKIEYETSPKALALQWLVPAQTAGKRQPFLFTKSSPIAARSWIPLQDTPQVRFTYKAIIQTAPELLAVMSAVNDAKVKRNGEYYFSMPEAIPSYLMALGVGDLKFKATGLRTGVYAERSVVVAASKEFADTEAMILACEKLFGPYRWGRYDILVMPPSFPIGGMENPRLSFITPTVIAGDRSLVSMIAHELAHSWSGNLVNNSTWRDLWLNEGFTVYLEGRIMEAVYGAGRASMEAVLGLQSFREELKGLKPADQVLAIDLRGRDPNLVFSAVPYEKGRLFLSFLENKFGRARFDEWLRGYFNQFAFQSVTTEQFLDYLGQNLLDRFPGIVTRAAALEWTSGSGLPTDAALPATDAFAEVDQARAAWLGAAAAAPLSTRGWVTAQYLYFLNGMPSSISADQMAELDRTLGFSRSNNAEIAHAWFKLAIDRNYWPSFPALEAYLRTIGRVKLIKPLYAKLASTPPGKEFAKRVYSLARPGYHPATVKAIDAIVND